ncbi:MAG: hypothetical protein ACTMKU_07300 [Actinomycetaceae bacterium]
MTHRTKRLSIAAGALLLAGGLGACQADEPVEQERPVAGGAHVVVNMEHEQA